MRPVVSIWLQKKHLSRIMRFTFPLITIHSVLQYSSNYLNCNPTWIRNIFKNILLHSQYSGHTSTNQTTIIMSQFSSLNSSFAMYDFYLNCRSSNITLLYNLTLCVCVSVCVCMCVCNCTFRWEKVPFN